MHNNVRVKSLLLKDHHQYRHDDQTAAHTEQTGHHAGKQAQHAIYKVDFHYV